MVSARDSVEMQPLADKITRPSPPEPIINVVDMDAAENTENTDTERWAWATASILVLFALPLLVSPRIFLLLSNVAEEARTVPTPLESFLSVHLGLGLICLALGVVLGMPNSPSSSPNAIQPAPAQHPLILPTSAAMLVSSLFAYNATRSVGTLGTLVSGASGLIGVWGTWVLLFGESPSISKTTGADKHTSRFLFGNKAAASAKKKQWKKEQEARRS